MVSYDNKKWIAEHPEEERYKHQFLDKSQSKVLFDVGVRSGQIVLDFGCGPGVYAVPAAKLVGDKGRVYALDINSEFLDKVEQMAKEEGLTNIVRIDASMVMEIPLKNKTVDVMLLIDVLHLIKDRETLFKEAHRILKRGGLIVAYPMHVTEKEVEDLAASRNLILESKMFQNRFLIFRKSS